MCSRATNVLSRRVSVSPLWPLPHGIEESRILCRPSSCPEWTNTQGRGCEWFAQLRSYISTSHEGGSSSLRGFGGLTLFPFLFFLFPCTTANGTKGLSVGRAISTPESSQEVDSRPEISPLRADRFSRFSPLRRGLARGAGGAVREPSGGTKRKGSEKKRERKREREKERSQIDEGKGKGDRERQGGREGERCGESVGEKVKGRQREREQWRRRRKSEKERPNRQ